jgi:hypothetical protein
MRSEHLVELLRLGADLCRILLADRTLEAVDMLLHVDHRRLAPKVTFVRQQLSGVFDVLPADFDVTRCKEEHGERADLADQDTLGKGRTKREAGGIDTAAGGVARALPAAQSSRFNVERSMFVL